ncbi:hypothetical protein M3193_08080 [Sporosarcina luteola]|uniref:hypothetical protein n=1 Tax=Sporosarcina luteola TaxID=582850 RepID=UPI00203AB8E5|nr:hypothetical protein [Sporosarcina luteola]MCM3744099.1 hypothetical protein [Sporosarcina luteola]
MFDEYLCRLRRFAFWNLDRIKGSPIKSAYNEIKKIDSLDSNDRFIEEYQTIQLEKLIFHAVNTTKIYSSFNNRARLAEFPVVNKNLIRNNQQDYISEKYKISELYKMSTSGSTGTPFVCYQDYNKKRRVNAEIIYYSEKAGYSVGNNLIFLRALTDKSRKTKFQQWIQNESLIDISSMDNKKINKILEGISKSSKNGSMILAYASTYDAFNDYFSKNGISIIPKVNITGIVSSSEMLFDHTRNKMKQIFNCKVLSRYSNQENGVIGQDDKENNVFILNEAHYIVEIFHLEKDEIVPEGDIGRIVITDLYNTGMPMIRYDTGDIGSITMIKYKGKMKKAINNFGGRKVDIIYDSYGNRLSPHIITNNFWAFPEIKQYQFIQKSANSYVVKINMEEKSFNIDTVRIMLKRLLGDKANISIELVDEIPELASGKRKYVISEIEKT